MSVSAGYQDSSLAQPQGRRTFLRIPIEFWALALVTLLAFLIRVWDLGGKGLWYDEAVTALTARATPAEIVHLHWQNAFEHPPVWNLFMHAWSLVFGQSEAALRWPAVVAGTLLVPLVWQILKLSRPADRSIRLLAALLVALSPVLTLYSQEARMYAIVTLLAAVSIYLCLRLNRSVSSVALVLWVLANWLMLGFHYYSILLVVAEALFFLIAVARGRRPQGWLAIGLALSVAPLVLWGALSPGFQTTVRVVLSQSDHSGPTWQAFGDRFWRELTLGSVVWSPQLAVVGYALLPLLLVGLWVDLRPDGTTALMVEGLPRRVDWGFFAIVFLLPILISLAIPNQILTRYILFVAPVYCILTALGIQWLWHWVRVLGAVAFMAAMVVALLGLSYYFTTYQKSAYRDMVRYLVPRTAPGDAILLEGPRQHLLAKYYLPADRRIYPIPDVKLPTYWTLTAPQVIPEQIDDPLKAILREHGDAWLILAGQGEVDPNDFVPRFLVAISYELDCLEQLDVRMCHYIDPGHVSVDLAFPVEIVFGGELQLTDVQLAQPAKGPDVRRELLVALDWTAKAKPSVDYAVTLRLLDQQGKIQAQVDGLPIGLLLPPTTWNAGDRKPGFSTIPIPEGTPPGDYDLVLGVYNSATGSLFEPLGLSGRLGDFVPLARVKLDDSGIQNVSESK